MEEYFSDRATKVMGSLAAVVGGMGLLGLALALSGIYGVMSWAVARRRREIGIRMAIGADRLAVVGMILKRGALLGVWGTAIGLALSLWLGRAISASAFMLTLDWATRFAGCARPARDDASRGAYIPAMPRCAGSKPGVAGGIVGQALSPANTALRLPVRGAAGVGLPQRPRLKLRRSAGVSCGRCRWRADRCRAGGGCAGCRAPREQTAGRTRGGVSCRAGARGCLFRLSCVFPHAGSRHARHEVRAA